MSFTLCYSSVNSCFLKLQTLVQIRFGSVFTDNRLLAGLVNGLFGLTNNFVITSDENSCDLSGDQADEYD